MAKRNWKIGLIIGLIIGTIISFLYSIPAYIFPNSSDMIVLVLLKVDILHTINPIYWLEMPNCFQAKCIPITLITTPIFYGLYGLLIGLIFKKRK